MCKSTCGDNAYFKGIIYIHDLEMAKKYMRAQLISCTRVCVAYIKCKWLLIIFAI